MKCSYFVWASTPLYLYTEPDSCYWRGEWCHYVQLGWHWGWYIHCIGLWCPWLWEDDLVSGRSLSHWACISGMGCPRKSASSFSVWFWNRCSYCLLPVNNHSSVTTCQNIVLFVRDAVCFYLPGRILPVGGHSPFLIITPFSTPSKLLC